MNVMYQHPPNYPLRDPIYHLIETIRPLIEVHWGAAPPVASGDPELMSGQENEHGLADG